MNVLSCILRQKHRLFLFLFLCISSVSQAGHIAGSYFHVEQLDSNRHIVYMTIIRDCNGIQLNTMGIRYRSGSSNFYDTLYSYHIISVKDITSLDTNCGVKSRCSGSFTYGFEEYVYADTIDLSGYSTCDWVAEFSQCCRSSSISAYYGSTYYNSIKFNKCIYNSSPKFIDSPRNLLLLNQDTKISFRAEDTIDQGDSLSYELAPALEDPNQSVTYYSNFTYLRPFTFLGWPANTAANPEGFHLNPHTGLVEFRPITLNQVSSIVVKVKEWRKLNGTMQVISETCMDNMFVVRSAAYAGHTSGINRGPSIQTTYEDYYLCTSDTFRLHIATHDSDFDSTYLSWDHGVSGSSFTTTNGTDLNASGDFIWKPSSSDVSIDPYILTFSVREKTCPIPATSIKLIRLFVRDSLQAANIDVGPDIIDSLGLDTINPATNISHLYNRPVLWTSSGDGHFIDSSKYNTPYVQGPNDKQGCSYQLKLEVKNILYCFSNGGVWSDSLLVTKKYPVLNLLGSNEIIYGDSLKLSIKNNPDSTQDFWWTSTGDGHFDDSTALQPNYIPGSNDWEGCGWTSYLHYETDACATSYDSVFSQRRITLYGHQMVPPVFRGDSIYLEAFLDSGSRSSVHWTSFRDGTFGDSTAAQTYYVPGTKDLQNCSYVAFVEEWPRNTCFPYWDTVAIKIIQPVFEAGPTIQLYYSDTAQLNALPLASATYQFAFWTTAGDGSFIDSNDAETRYIPGTSDWANCGTTLYWHEIDQACGGRIDSIQIFRITTTVDAGSDQTQYFASGMNFTLQGVSDTANGQDAYWTTSGDGNFNDSFDLNAVYTPGTIDVASCSPITLRLTGYPIGTCTVFDEMTVLVDDSSTVRYVGIQIDSMTFDTIHLSISPVDTRGSLTWSSDGTGTFVNQTQGGADYVLSAQDHQRFSIGLMVTRQAPCGSTTDIISIDPQSILQGIQPVFKGLVLYPNPASKSIRLDWEGSHGAVTLQVMDVLGKSLISRDMSSNESSVEFDLSQLAQGSYLLYVVDKAGNRQIIRFSKK